MTLEIGSVVKMEGGQNFVVTEVNKAGVCGIPIKGNKMIAGPGSAGTLRPPLTETGITWDIGTMTEEMTRVGFTKETILVFLSQF